MGKFKKKLCVMSGIIAVCMCFGIANGFAQMADAVLEKVPSRPNSEAGPTKVKTAVWLIDIDSIDSAAQNFVANVFVRMVWYDSRLAHGRKDLKRYALEDVWSPRIQIANEIGIVRKTMPDIVDVEADGKVIYRQRFVGPFSQPMELHNFPFDQHAFGIHLVSVGSDKEEIEFNADPEYLAFGLKDASGISDDISLPDWKVLEHSAKAKPYVLAPGKETAGYMFEFTGKRSSQHFWYKVIFPLFLIVGMSWMVFWVPPENLGTQIGIATTSMLTLIAYRFAVDALVPKVPYMTRLDGFIFSGTLLVFLSLIEVNLTGQLFIKGRPKLANTIDLFSRFMFPLVFFAAAYYTLLSKGF